VRKPNHEKSLGRYLHVHGRSLLEYAHLQ
ncbi:hypothetical protein D049_4237, partial [Vibrio parahaemolyticus VPTS-2010]